MIGLFAAFLIALIVTWAVTPRVLKLAVRCGALAVPRDRDVHDVRDRLCNGAERDIRLRQTFELA